MWLLNAMIIAIAMYSKIPMPRVDWNEKNMRYAMCFFPLVGVADTEGSSYGSICDHQSLLLFPFVCGDF